MEESRGVFDQATLFWPRKDVPFSHTRGGLLAFSRTPGVGAFGRIRL